MWTLFHIRKSASLIRSLTPYPEKTDRDPAAPTVTGGGGGVSVCFSIFGIYGLMRYSKELSLRNQPLETQHWILAQFLRNWLAGSETLSF